MKTMSVTADERILREVISFLDRQHLVHTDTDLSLL